MGRLIYSAIATLDGFTTDAAGGFEWGVPSEEVLADINAESRTVGTYLYGRRMYETMTVWETDPAAAALSPGSADFAAIWTAAEKVVYSTTLASVSTRRTRLATRMDADEVEALKRSSDADLYVAGPTLAAEALRLGVVDRLHLYLCPVTVGGGLPMLPTDLRLDLRLTSERRYENGMLGLEYDVRR